MFVRARPPPPVQPRVTSQPLPLSDAVWEAVWPFWLSSSIGFLMLLCTMTIGALEIASLSKSTDTDIFGNTSSTGAGLWCGLFMLIASLLILMLICINRVYLWATISFITTLIAAGFSGIIIGLDARAVQDGQNISHSVQFWGSKWRILVAQLAFSAAELFLCIVYIMMYIVITLVAPSRSRRPTPRRGF